MADVPDLTELLIDIDPTPEELADAIWKSSRLTRGGQAADYMYDSLIELMIEEQQKHLLDEIKSLKEKRQNLIWDIKAMEIVIEEGFVIEKD